VDIRLVRVSFRELLEGCPRCQSDEENLARMFAAILLLVGAGVTIAACVIAFFLLYTLW